MSATAPRFKDIAAKVAANGYAIVPLTWCEKKPCKDVRDWPRYRYEAGHEKHWPDAGLGILCHNVTAVDIDIYDEALAEQAAALVQERLGLAPKRIGRFPKVALIYRTEAPIKKLQTQEFKLPGAVKTSKVEFLGNGQQLVAYNIHEETGKPYRWNGSGEPLTTPREALHLVTEHQLEALRVELEALLAQHGKPLIEQAPPKDDQRQGESTVNAADLIGAVVRGAALHDSLLALAAHYAGLGFGFTQIVELLQGLMLASTSEHDERWTDRYEDIPRLTHSALKKFKGNEPLEWTEPLNIFREVVAAPFSADDVPECVARFSTAFSSSTGFDQSAAIVTGVAAAAAVIDDRYRLAVRHGSGWFESARIWAAIIGGPSAGKSPTIRAATDPIKQLHREQWAAWHKANVDLKPQDREPEPCLFTSDTTLEALSDVLRNNPRGMLMLTEEFASWIGSIDAYRNGQGSRDRGEMLQLYDGGPHQVHRVTRGSVFMPNWGASVIAAGTPAGMRQHVKQLPDDGLIHRFIPCVMRRPTVSRGTSLKDPLEAWESQLRGLFQSTSTATTAQRARLTPEASVAFEAEAASIREATADVEALCPALASHLGKHPGMLARVALTFHLLSSERSDGVSVSTIEKAARFMRSARKHAAALFMDILQTSPVRDLARAAGRAIVAAMDAPAQVSRAWLSTHCRQFRDAPDYQRRAAIEFLEDAHWLVPLSDARPYGGWGATCWNLNPLVPERFKAVGEEHRKRRAAVRAAFLGEES